MSGVLRVSLIKQLMNLLGQTPVLPIYLAYLLLAHIAQAALIVVLVRVARS